MADNPYSQSSATPSSTPSAGPGPGMAQCSVTHKWFPEDELIMFQGQLVSAEGKQVLLDRLLTGADAPDAMIRPGAWRRIGCIFLVDGILIGVFSIIVNYMFGIPLGTPTTDLSVMFNRIVASVVALSAAILYFGLLHGWKGQSLGKMVGNLRVVNLDGSPVSKPQAFARAVVYLLGNILFIPVLILGAVLKSPQFVIIGSLLAGAWGLANGIAALVDTRMQRTLHDRICGTRVIVIHG